MNALNSPPLPPLTRAVSRGSPPRRVPMAVASPLSRTNSKKLSSPSRRPSAVSPTRHRAPVVPQTRFRDPQSTSRDDVVSRTSLPQESVASSDTNQVSALTPAAKTPSSSWFPVEGQCDAWVEMIVEPQDSSFVLWSSLLSDTKSFKQPPATPVLFEDTVRSSISAYLERFHNHTVTSDDVKVQIRPGVAASLTLSHQSDGSLCCTNAGWPLRVRIAVICRNDEAPSLGQLLRTLPLSAFESFSSLYNDVFSCTVNPSQWRWVHPDEPETVAFGFLPLTASDRQRNVAALVPCSNSEEPRQLSLMSSGEQHAAGQERLVAPYRAMFGEWCAKRSTSTRRNAASAPRQSSLMSGDVNIVQRGEVRHDRHSAPSIDNGTPRTPAPHEDEGIEERNPHLLRYRTRGWSDERLLPNASLSTSAELTGSMHVTRGDNVALVVRRELSHHVDADESADEYIVSSPQRTGRSIHRSQSRSPPTSSLAMGEKAIFHIRLRRTS